MDAFLRWLLATGLFLAAMMGKKYGYEQEVWPLTVLGTVVAVGAFLADRLDRIENQLDNLSLLSHSIQRRLRNLDRSAS